MSLGELLRLPFFVAALPILLLFFLSLKGKSDKHGSTPPSPQPRLPIIGHLHFVGPLLHQSLHRLSLRWGPIFSLRLGSLPCVVASSPHLAKQILSSNELFFDWRFQTKAVERLSQNCSFAFAPYGPYWKIVRKLSTNEFLGTRRVNYFQAARAEESRGLLRLLAQKAEAREVVNLSEELLKLTNNVICRMMLGQAVEAWTVVRDVSNIFNLFNMSDFIWLFSKLDLQGFGKRVDNILERFDAILDRLITKHQQEAKAGKTSTSMNGCHEIKCFLDALLDYSENGDTEVELTRAHIKAILVDFFTAGMDNLAIAAEWCLAELINHPMILERAREEIRNVVGNSRLAEESDCPSLPYIQAVVMETYRLHPPLPVTSRRCLQDCTIDNYVIRKNTVLFVNLWAMGRDAKNWENPLEFCPERFLKSSEADGCDLQVDVGGQNSPYLPFGSGRRMCPGKALAMQEIPALIAEIIQCFDFQIIGTQGEKLSTMLDMDERPGFTAPRASNLLCVPIARRNVLDILSD